MAFQDKVAVITGAASGIGRGLAERGHAQGMKLVLADRDAGALAALAASLDGAIAVPTDVTDPAALVALADTAWASFGGVDYLFNNAGIMATGYSWEIEPARWDASINVNLKGILHGIRAFVPRMIAQGRGHIVNTASVGGFGASPLMAPYSVTKFAAVALTESLHAELAMIGAPVGVSLLAPGPVKTGIFDNPFGDIANPAAERFVEELRHMLDTYGLEPGPFADKVYAALAAGEFWIVPQPEALDPMLKARTETILERRTPSFAWDGGN
ncbi:NADP-dependent 3-hydroxy acid dehydrogenase YdfG [Sphingomonas laterariae]|uniref:NADP-dependent 3-hydroxy acid dehydrogenase YdfG n=1 Tax=Edaphosphingomonas laterariae TaxID=861865 RepID=A0A239E0T5_9SPHN|nr:SDR family NAD(P)-dependent oxidoreductase [Sphingomonas laterariae]SNS38330.1 NADP-dependent 3-hydroxy acid dehydrogenase YdfG [Sphingomonas laterariae]